MHQFSPLRISLLGHGEHCQTSKEHLTLFLTCTLHRTRGYLLYIKLQRISAIHNVTEVSQSTVKRIQRELISLRDEGEFSMPTKHYCWCTTSMGL